MQTLPKAKWLVFSRVAAYHAVAIGNPYPFHEGGRPQQPKLRKKTVGKAVYWVTKTGGDTYFGRVVEVSHPQSRKLFAAHLDKLHTETQASKGRTLTVGELMDEFLEWVQKHRSEQSSNTRCRYCPQFGSQRVGEGDIRLRDWGNTEVR